MGIFIDQITATSLGPLDQFDESLSRFNLIYSPNEGGKTLLTEFIIRCLFKNHWQNQGLGKGKVVLKGLSEAPQEFSVSTKTKLDDYLNKTKGLPIALAKLLVVKGSDPKIAAKDGGMDKDTLRTLLSEKQMLDNILSQIPKTEQKATVQDGIIEIERKGNGKIYKERKTKLDQINDQIEWLDQHFSTGKLQDLKNRESQIRELLNQQKRAKQYLAYTTSEALKKIRRQLSDYDQEAITNLYRDIEQYEQRKKELEQSREALQRTRKAYEFYTWLQSATEQYQASEEQVTDPPHLGWLIVAGVGFLGGLTALLWGDDSLTIFLLALMAVCITVYIWRNYQFMQSKPASQTLETLKAEFRQKTNKTLHSKADLDSLLTQYRDEPSRLEMQKDKVSELEENQTQLQESIQQRLRTLTGKAIDPEAWRDELSAIDAHAKELQEKEAQLRDQLTSLGVDESDYLAEPTEETYSKARLEALQQEWETVQQSLSEEENQLAHIKSQIGFLVGENLVGVDFNTAYEKLLEKRETVRAELKDLEAWLVADVWVTELVDELKAEDDQKIEAIIGSEALEKPLQQLTNYYRKLGMDHEGRLLIKSDWEDFYLTDLSTGTREQVLLALRAGIASYLLREDTMFLILDDAFQNSDWIRRPQIVEQLAYMAEAGWQIMYLTMDDHIRDLFDEMGEKHFGEDYKKVYLSP